MGTNLLLIGDEDLINIEVKKIGNQSDGSLGFSAFQFLPNSGDQLIIALKSQEKDGVAVASYITIFNVKTGHILLDDAVIPGGAYKYEGILCV